MIFQPLLHDPLGWKSTNTTYNDTFKSRNYGSVNKEKKPSPYGQEYQRQMRKRQRQIKFQSTNEEEPTPRVILLKKCEENREVPSGSYQLSRSKTLPVTVEDPPALMAEYKNRPTSTYKVSPFTM